MDLQKYINQHQKLQKHLLVFLDNPSNNETSFNDLFSVINTINCLENKEELELFLHFLSNIANNHCRQNLFIEKIDIILQHFHIKLNQNWSNYELFKLFKKNKLILYLLIKRNIIPLDQNILNFIVNNDDIKQYQYFMFFFPEIKKFADDHHPLIINNENISPIFICSQDFINDINEKRLIGENESYISSLIRNDSIKEFSAYFKRSNLSLSKTKLNPSVFETNNFLMNKTPTLIEYAAFFGAIQIFKYLLSNNVEIPNSLCIYAIHSNNLELITLLVKNHLVPKDLSYEECLIEAIKCHHNDVFLYIQNNLYGKKQSYNESIISSIIKYKNYVLFPKDFSSNFAFYYLCKYNYYSLVFKFLQSKHYDIERKIVLFKSIYNEIAL